LETVNAKVTEIEAVAFPQEQARDVSHVSQFTLLRWRFMQNKLSLAGGIMLVIMYAMAALAPFISPYSYDRIDTNFKYAAPTAIHIVDGRPAVCGLTQTLDVNTFTWTYQQDCSHSFPITVFARGDTYGLFGITSDIHLFGVDPPGRILLLGADSQGRDVLSRILEGSRISLTVGLVGVALSVVLGSILGTISGYMGGPVDNLIQRFVELIASIPYIPLWAALAAVLPREMPITQRYFYITLVLSLVSWTGLARQVRGKVLAYRMLEYTLAARLAGASRMKIILTHMLPNAISHIIVVAAFGVPFAILGETALSFLGLGMLPPAVSWGVLLRDAQQVQSVVEHPWLLTPAVAVILAVISYQFLADGLRDAADPYG
jgi:peptide/nickel transport system permease protein